MQANFRRPGWWVGAAGLLALLTGCSIGPRALERTHGRYNEAMRRTTEEQLLLNVVRLRYLDTPSSVAVSSIAAQFAAEAEAGIQPFFEVGNTPFSRILPFAQGTAADRPTLTLTPQDDTEFTQRLFAPITLEGLAYLTRTTGPASTVFRLWLEGANRVSNAETASGPTPAQAPEYERFLRGVRALQVLQDNNWCHFTAEDRAKVVTAGLPPEAVISQSLAEAAKGGYVYDRVTTVPPAGEKAETSWNLVRKSQQPAVRINPDRLAEPAVQEFVDAFHLTPGQTVYEFEGTPVDPYSPARNPDGFRALHLDTRSLLQVLYFASTAVEVPPADQARGVVTVTTNPDGSPFDWGQVTGGLLRIQSCASHRRPKPAAVAVKYRGHWFYIDDRDTTSKATFSLLLEVSRLKLGEATKSGAGPVLTLPLAGGR